MKSANPIYYTLNLNQKKFGYNLFMLKLPVIFRVRSNRRAACSLCKLFQFQPTMPFQVTENPKMNSRFPLKREEGNRKEGRKL